MKILACDPGSSSYKAALYDLEADASLLPAPPLWSGQADWKKGDGQARVRGTWQAAPTESFSVQMQTGRDAVAALFDHFFSDESVEGVGRLGVDNAVHRVVHGGSIHSESAPITDDVEAEIRQAIPLAPEHNATTLAGIRAVRSRFGAINQMALFDSFFHATLPERASTYATPLSWREVWGMRRLGFHGISHQYCAQRCAALMETDLSALRIVSCHLGNGASIAAIDRGRSVDTTMGWTPLDGLVMGERCGSVDPGMILLLIESRRFTPSELRCVLNEESGLRGLSGVSGDMRDVVEAMTDGHPRARLAFDVYTHRLRASIAAMAASLGGLDGMVFTGGVGEHSPQVRAAACENLDFLNLRLNAQANRRSRADSNIAQPGRHAPIFIVHSDECWAMARTCARLLGGSDQSSSGSTRDLCAGRIAQDRQCPA